ncbi:MAG TPA: Omp28-related outer membrane protein, partial [Saprospiraceae bacterium]|nr:Omp28-related outer membrane protein [Saprospiraceae bacterium]
MKLHFYLLFTGIGLFLELSAQAPRRVLVEEFTQASCPPCAVYNPGFHKIIFTPGNETKVSLLCYQTSWPGSDPMNIQNPSDVSARVNYYAVNAVPDCLTDGGVTESGTPIFHGNIADYHQQIIDDRAAVTSPFSLTVDHELRSKLDSVTLTATVTNASGSSLPADYTLHLVLIEKTIDFHVPPGTNGELEFFSVTRKMVPNSSGTKLALLDPGASASFSFTIAIPSYIYNLRNLGVIGFVQNTLKKEVMQSAESYPKPLPTAASFLDLETGSSVVGFNGLCDANISYKVDFENKGTDSIRTVSIDLMVNNVKRTGQTALAINLPAGGTGSYEFKNVNIPAGRAALNYRINNINSGARDIDKLNHTGAPAYLFTVESAPFAKEVHERFEVSARGVIPPHNYVENYSIMRVYPSDRGFFGVGQEIGGFGNSVYSLFWDFYFGPEKTEVGYFFDKIDLSTSTNTAFMISRAFAQKAGEPTRLLVEVSKDCGTNWTTIYEKTGSELATVAPLSTTFFAPTADQWVRDTVSMKDFDGEAEVIVRLRAYNPEGGSNLMFLDDIDIAPLSPVAVEDAGIISGLKVFPNPVHDEMQLEIHTIEAAI